ncbi:MAG: DinB family protein [Bacteroidota bacterium]
MFNPTTIIDQMDHHQSVFTGLLQNVPLDKQAWKPDAEQWSLLEIVCHLYDIEGEDFRIRVQYVLEDPQKTLPSIHPTTWPVERNYLGQNFEQKVLDFLAERQKSISWLRSLQNPQWDNTYQHPTLGPMSAALFLSNWLAHDQLHIRQINRVHRQYLQQQTGMDLNYAGNW